MSSYSNRFLVALGASASIHLLVLWVWIVMLTLNVITGRATKAPPPPLKQQVAVLKLIEPPKPRPRPSTFVETDSSQESKDKPKDSSYYSDRSTKAAQPKAETEKSDKPKLEGKQDKVMSTANIPLPQPTPPPPPEPPKPQIDLQKNLAPEPEIKPEPKPVANSVGPKKSDLAMVTKEPQPKSEAAKPPAPPKKDPTEQKLAALKPERIIPETEKKMDGGVSREDIKAIEVTGTVFGAYDRRLISAVKTRWLALLEQYTIPGERSGQVSLKFHLNADGSVSELVVAENSAGDILAIYCQKAVTDSAPFGPWPDELKDMVKRNYRELNFVFYY
ncbi:MAG: hypothetical protein EXS18_04950 [Verrucomicrobiae bacterium]|nr:hypothetical protein [Verrucomicrobiae bacterium]